MLKYHPAWMHGTTCGPWYPSDSSQSGLEWDRRTVCGRRPAHPLLLSSDAAGASSSPPRAVPGRPGPVPAGPPTVLPPSSTTIHGPAGGREWCSICGMTTGGWWDRFPLPTPFSLLLRADSKHSCPDTDADAAVALDPYGAASRPNGGASQLGAPHLPVVDASAST
jgi:hypothetical protein